MEEKWIDARKAVAIVLFIAIVVFGYASRQQLLAWVHAGGFTAAVVGVVLAAILVFVPVMPFVVVAGLIGAVFGTWSGTFITLLGAVLGSMVMFFMARFGFRSFAQHMLAKYPKAREYETYFEKRAFLAILLARVIPVIPAPAVNVVCGLSRVRWYTFLAATLLGKIPVIMTFTFAGSRFANSKITSFAVYGVYFIIIFAASLIYTLRSQRQANGE